MTKNNKTWEEEFDEKFRNCLQGVWLTPTDPNRTEVWVGDELKSFIASQIEKTRREAIDYIAKKYGDDFTDGCGCCMEKTLNEALKKELNK